MPSVPFPVVLIGSIALSAALIGTVVILAWSQSQEDKHIVLIHSELMAAGSDNIKIERVKASGVQGGFVYRMKYTDATGRKTEQSVFVFTAGSKKDQIHWGDREIIGSEPA